MEVSSLKLKKFLYFMRETAKREKQKFLIYIPLKNFSPHFGMTADETIKGKNLMKSLLMKW